MADRPINLNRARKRKSRAERARKAQANRTLHGQTRAERDRERLERGRLSDAPQNGLSPLIVTRFTSRR